MTAPDRSWVVVAVGLVATAIIAAALGAVVTLWAVDQPVSVAHAAPPVPKPVPPAVPVAAPAPVAAVAPIAPPAAAAPTPAPAETPPPADPPPAPPAPAAPVPAAAPAPPPPAPPVDTAAVAPKLPYAVQFGAFTDDGHAQHMVQTLEARGLPVQVEFHTSPKGHDLHFVRLDDGYSTMGEAASRAAALRRQLDIEVIAVRRQGAELAP